MLKSALERQISLFLQMNQKKNLHPDFFSISDIKSGDSNITSIHFWFLHASRFVLEVKEHRNFQIKKHFGYTDKLYKREQ